MNTQAPRGERGAGSRATDRALDTRKPLHLRAAAGQRELAHELCHAHASLWCLNPLPKP